MFQVLLIEKEQDISEESSGVNCGQPLPAVIELDVKSRVQKLNVTHHNLKSSIRLPNRHRSLLLRWKYLK